MLVIKRSAGITTEANLRNLLRTGKEVPSPGINLGFENHGRHSQKSKTEVSNIKFTTQYLVVVFT